MTKNEQLCKDFNFQVPVGSVVQVRKDDGAFLHTTTTSEAYVLSGHTPVVHLKDISGCYALDRIETIWAKS